MTHFPEILSNAAGEVRSVIAHESARGIAFYERWPEGPWTILAWIDARKEAARKLCPVCHYFHCDHR